MIPQEVLLRLQAGRPPRVRVRTDISHAISRWIEARQPAGAWHEIMAMPDDEIMAATLRRLRAHPVALRTGRRYIAHRALQPHSRIWLEELRGGAWLPVRTATGDLITFPSEDAAHAAIDLIRAPYDAEIRAAQPGQPGSPGAPPQPAGRPRPGQPGFITRLLRRLRRP